MLSSSSSDRKSTASGTTTTVEVAQDALEVASSGTPGAAGAGGCNGMVAGYEDPSLVGVELLSGKVGATRVSVQPRGGSAGADGEPLLVGVLKPMVVSTAHVMCLYRLKMLLAALSFFQAGIFPDTAILTMHNSELEVLPQSAYKLPRGTEKVLLLDDKVMLVATSSRSDTSARCRRGHLHLVSTLHAELHVEFGVKNESSVLQSFSLGPQEAVVALLKCSVSRPPKNKILDNDQGAFGNKNQNTAEAVTAQQPSSSQSTTASSSSSSTWSGDRKTAAAKEKRKTDVGSGDDDLFCRRVQERSNQVGFAAGRDCYYST